jgi:CubicO group peptidase (beta-lactamase class C family)
MSLGRLTRRAWLAGAAASVAPATAEAFDLGDRETFEATGLPDAAGFQGEPVGRRTIAQAMHDHAVPGVSFALIDRGRLQWARGWGVRGEGGSPVDAGTVFQAGSISSPVAAIGALRLRDAGRIDLDRDVQAYLGDYRLPPGKQDARHPVTLRNLMSHTSGVTPGGYVGYAPGQPSPTNQLSAQGRPPANSPRLEVIETPGARLAWSGGGYTLIEIALQNVSGLPFETLMRELVLGPVGMASSTYAQLIPPSFAARAALGHRFNGKAVPGGWMIHPEQAAAGLWSTPSDLAAFMVEVRNAWLGRGRVLSRRAALDFLTVQTEDEGLGVTVHGEGPSLEFHHGGSTRGFSCFMIMENVQAGRGAVFMTNSDNGYAVGFGLLRAAAASYGWRRFRPSLYRRASLPPEALQPLVGLYRFGPDTAVRVTYAEAGNQITVHFPNGDAYPMTPIGARRYVYAREGKVIAFEGEGPGLVLLVDGETGRREP